MTKRPIKFRAWLEEWNTDAPIKGKMFYDVIPMGGWDEWWIAFDGHEQGYDGSWKPGEGIEIMQFTGLTDKNGKEIYEGDIISQPDPYGTNEPQISVVEWGWAGFSARAKKRDWGIENIGRAGTEVIGNIYENPELLSV